jgi:maleylpyruvate isomerase
MKLYSHWRSSASYRVRIALNLKALTFEQVTLDLGKSHADQHRPEYRRVNPQGVVPSLELDDGTVLTQSMSPACCPRGLKIARSCAHYLK